MGPYVRPSSLFASQGGAIVARRRRKKRSRPFLTAVVLVIAVVLSWWWLFSGDDPAGEVDPALVLGPKPTLTTDRPESPPRGVVRHDVSEKGADLDHEASPTQQEPTASRAKSLINAGKQALARNDLVAARAHFSEAMAQGVSDSDATFMRAELTRIGSETIFSSRVFDNDPFIERYIIQPGDTLAKIASKNLVSADLLANINNIADKNLIRAGQTIKLVKGPMRAVIDRQTFSLDVYLGNTFVRHYQVGLGADGSTPGGEWRVGTKLKNPTYYPPRGGRIIAADDPENPLAERWIGLVGVGGSAVGQQRYGIHGTIEPDSIGREASLGCIRMYNEDVAELYTYLVEKHSAVTIR